MTDLPERTEAAATTAVRGGGRTVVTLVALTAVLLLPLLGGLFYAAHEAIQHKSPTDWRANHEVRESLENAAVLIVGAPSLGAGIFWLLGTVLGRRPGVSAAMGALIGTLGLWIAGIVSVYVAFSNASF